MWKMQNFKNFRYLEQILHRRRLRFSLQRKSLCEQKPTHLQLDNRLNPNPLQPGLTAGRFALKHDHIVCLLLTSENIHCTIIKIQKGDAAMAVFYAKFNMITVQQRGEFVQISPGLYCRT